MLTYQLPMLSTFFVTDVAATRFKYNYLKNNKTFSQLFALLLKSTLNCKQIVNKMTVIAYVFPKLQTAQYVIRQISKEPSFRTPSESEHAKGSQKVLKSA